VTTFVLGAKVEKGFKFVKMSLENCWRKEIQKKEKGVGAAGPTRLPFGPSSRAAQPPLPSPVRGRARLALPGAGHAAAVRRRRRRGRPADRLIPVGTPPRAPRTPHSVPLPTPSSSPLACSSGRGGAPPCAIGVAAQLPTPTTRVRLNPPQVSRAGALGQAPFCLRFVSVASRVF